MEEIKCRLEISKINIEYGPCKEVQSISHIRTRKGLIVFPPEKSATCPLLYQPDLSELAKTFGQSRIAQGHTIVPDGYL